MKQFITLSIFLFLLASCAKDENGGSEDPDQPLFFASLEAEKDTIESGGSTKISAVASGYKLTFYWSASAGDILGSGSEVLYTASPCHIGKNTITCIVRDGKNVSQSKEIFIVVE
ncbi:MAG: hypothetical protein ABII90_11640 [Bacteroidota bacterium]